MTTVGLVAGAHTCAQVTLYERQDYEGKSFTATHAVVNLQRQGLDGRATSVVVQGNRWERWELCEDARFRGRCVVLQPGQYASLAAMGLNNRVSSVRAVDPGSSPLAAAAVARQIDCYEHDGFQGRTFVAVESVPDFRSAGFNDCASSVVVTGLFGSGAFRLN